MGNQFLNRCQKFFKKYTNYYMYSVYKVKNWTSFKTRKCPSLGLKAILTAVLRLHYFDFREKILIKIEAEKIVMRIP